MNNYLIIGVFCVFIGVVNTQSNLDYYIGAVVDFASKHESSKTPLQNIQENLNEYEQYIRKASQQGANIIVFPECGLTSIHLPAGRNELLPYTCVIPDPKVKIINPCDENKVNPVKPWSVSLVRLSCAAQQNNIYVVANLPERVQSSKSSDNEENEIIHNTNVVFDTTGALIARYRKYNLFVEPGFSPTPEPELITFTTNFGVTFGTFICFDILFPAPALQLLRKYENVTDIVYPTAWFSELPFLTAAQTQAGWARANGVNLLAAGYNNPAGGSGGSGIYRVDGHLNYTMPILHQTYMIVDTIPKINKRKTVNTKNTMPGIQTGVSRADPHLVTLKENMTAYTTELINSNLTNYTLCHENSKFCCNFTVNLVQPKNPDYYYRMIVYEGIRIFGILKHEVQICGIAACSDQNKQSCGHRLSNNAEERSTTFNEIVIIGESFLNNENSLFIPTITDYALYTTSNYDYKTIEDDKFKIIELKTLKTEQFLLGFGIFGVVQSSVANQTAFIPLLIIGVFTVLIFKKIY